MNLVIGIALIFIGGIGYILMLTELPRAFKDNAQPFLKVVFTLILLTVLVIGGFLADIPGWTIMLTSLLTIFILILGYWSEASDQGRLWLTYLGIIFTGLAFLGLFFILFPIGI